MATPNPLLELPGMPALQERVEKRLLAAVESHDPVMNAMASHLVRAGGKRQRPLLTALSSATAATGGYGTGGGAIGGVGRDGAGGDGTRRDGTGRDGTGRDGTGGGAIGDVVTDDAVTGGVACELVQVGSLHHDDVIDEAATRRGVESVNARWGNMRAILSGDFLLARASELAASLGTEVAALLAATIGRLCEGEVRELELAYRVDRTLDDYLTAIAGKTAALFATSCRIGGIVAGLPPRHIDSLTEFGRQYGLAFQVVDDILDVVASDQELGKPAGHDMAEGIYTLPVLRALEGPEGDELRSLLGAPLDPETRLRALDLVRRSGGVARASAEAATYVDAAVAAVATLPPSRASGALAGAARHLLVGVERAPIPRA